MPSSDFNIELLVDWDNDGQIEAYHQFIDGELRWTTPPENTPLNLAGQINRQLDKLHVNWYEGGYPDTAPRVWGTPRAWISPFNFREYSGITQGTEYTIQKLPELDPETVGSYDDVLANGDAGELEAYFSGIGTMMRDVGLPWDGGISPMYTPNYQISGYVTGKLDWENGSAPYIQFGEDDEDNYDNKFLQFNVTPSVVHTLRFIVSIVGNSTTNLAIQVRKSNSDFDGIIHSETFTSNVGYHLYEAEFTPDVSRVFIRVVRLEEEDPDDPYENLYPCKFNMGGFSLYEGTAEETEGYLFTVSNPLSYFDRVTDRIRSVSANRGILADDRRVPTEGNLTVQLNNTDLFFAPGLDAVDAPEIKTGGRVLLYMTATRPGSFVKENQLIWAGYLDRIQIDVSNPYEVTLSCVQGLYRDGSEELNMPLQVNRYMDEVLISLLENNNVNRAELPDRWFPRLRNQDYQGQVRIDLFGYDLERPNLETVLQAMAEHEGGYIFTQRDGYWILYNRYITRVLNGVYGFPQMSRVTQSGVSSILPANYDDLVTTPLDLAHSAVSVEYVYGEERINQVRVTTTPYEVDEDVILYNSPERFNIRAGETREVILELRTEENNRVEALELLPFGGGSEYVPVDVSQSLADRLELVEASMEIQGSRIIVTLTNPHTTKGVRVYLVIRGTKVTTSSRVENIVTFPVDDFTVQDKIREMSLEAPYLTEADTLELADHHLYHKGTLYGEIKSFVLRQEPGITMLVEPGDMIALYLDGLTSVPTEPNYLITAVEYNFRPSEVDVVVQVRRQNYLPIVYGGLLEDEDTPATVVE